jgi:hypothetical protein
MVRPFILLKKMGSESSICEHKNIKIEIVK